jgi:hypothetical protein
MAKTPLTRAHFFQLCQKLAEMAEEFKEEGPSRHSAAVTLSGLLRFRVSDGALQQAEEATGIRWERKSRRRDFRGLPPYGSLVKAVADLYGHVEALYAAAGRPVPEGLLPDCLKPGDEKETEAPFEANGVPR